MTKQKTQKKLITQIEASRIIGVHRSVISLGVTSGRFKRYKKNGKVFVDINQVKDVYKTTTKKSGSPSKSEHLQKVNGKSKYIIKDSETGELLDIHDIKLQTERNRALREKIQLEAAQGNYVKVEDVAKEFSTIAENLKKSILAIPNRIGPILAGESDPHTATQILINELKRSLQGTVERKLKEYADEGTLEKNKSN